MAQSKPCVACREPVTKQTILICCNQPCHLTCATLWGKKSTNPDSGCFSCGYGNSIPVLEILNEEWKEDPQFVKEVKRNWYQHTYPGVTHHRYPLWYGIGYQLKCGEPICLGGVKGSGEDTATGIPNLQNPSFLATPQVKSFQG